MHWCWAFCSLVISPLLLQIGEQEPSTIHEYFIVQRQQGFDLTVRPCGLLISEIHSFLGVTPDGTVYDPSDTEHPLEGKCPYIHRDRTPLKACVPPGICCIAETPHPDHSPMLQLQCKHSYFAQVQTQMTVGGRIWCEFIFTNKGINVERVAFDKFYWQNTLLPKLQTFFKQLLGYRNC